MKLATHNMLTSCIIKNVKKGFPLIIEATKVEEKKVDFDPEFTKRTIHKMEWDAVVAGAKNIGKEEQCPPEIPPNFENDEEFLKRAHHILMEVEIEEGNLICPESKRKFPIQNGIPNMLLEDDEIL